MPKFKKQIIPEGSYLYPASNGERKIAKFDKSRLSTICENTNRMIEAGLKIPTPFKHLKRAVPVTESVSSDSYQNGGYWTKFWIEHGKDGDALWGEVEADGDVEDSSSFAGKINKAFKEVSACVRDSWTDGLGREWGPCVLHTAIVNHPVIPNQKDFETVEDSITLSLDGMLQPLSNVDIAELSKELADSSKIYIPPSTLLEDLPRVLMISLRQKKLLDDSDDYKDTVVNPEPVYMSLELKEMPLTKKEVDEIVRLGLLNPATQKPVSANDFDIEDDPRDVMNLALARIVDDEHKSHLREKVEGFVADGRVTEDYAKSNLYPKIEEYRLSLGEGGKLKDRDIDGIISFIDSQPAKKGTTTPPNPHAGETVHSPEDISLALTDEEAEKMQKEMLSYMGN